MKEPVKIRRPSPEWGVAVIRAVVAYEAALPDGLLGTLVDALTELVEVERLDAVRLDRQRRVPVPFNEGGPRTPPVFPAVGPLLQAQADRLDALTVRVQLLEQLDILVKEPPVRTARRRPVKKKARR